MTAVNIVGAIRSPAALEQRLQADLRQLSRQQTQAPPPTIDLGVKIDELAVQSDQVALQQAQLNGSDLTVAGSADATDTAGHLDVSA